MQVSGIGDIFNLIFFGPVINLLVLIFQGLQALHIPGALGFAILFLTILIRILVWPFMASQIKATKKMADLKPHLDALKKKHKGDKQAFAAAQMALYKEHGVNPAGGCLPALIQIPVFIALYQSIIHILPGGNINQINSLLYFPQLKLPSTLDPNFFGLNLGIKPSEFGSQGFLLLLIPLLTAGLTFVQSKMTLPKPIKHYPSDSPKEEKEKEGLEESMGQVQSQMVYLMPIMIGYFAFSFPVGLAIYWNTYTILGIIQQHRVSGWGGLTDLTVRIKNLKFKISKKQKDYGKSVE
ncbi:YidC/Oxa1 family membrane protein insertase [Candidatus Daviesbacteria bacterium]|nr:YidC/Oxa1 family membrane protein insertase [Candidatus Daviesbacteria bacterium]